MVLLYYIDKRTTWKRIVILFCTSVIFSTFIVTMFFGKIKLIPDATMDSLSFYTGDTFFNNLAIQGEEGRRAYLLLHVIDYLFITQFYFLFVLLINLLIVKISSTKKIAFLSLIPLFSATMDFLENIFIDLSIILYPTKIFILGRMSGYFTFLKMYSIYLIFIMIFVLLILVSIKAVKKRVFKQKKTNVL